MLEIQIGQYPQVFILVLARVAAVLGVLQLLGGTRVFPVFKTAVALIVTMGLWPGISAPWMRLAAQLDNTFSLFLAVLQEVGIGACIGLAGQLVLSATSIAGALMGMGSSLMMARSIDPSSGRNSVLPQQILMSLLVVFLLITNTHLELIRLLAESFRTLPIMAVWDGRSLMGLVLSTGTQMFEWGLRLAMPVFCAALVMDSCLGLIARLAPNFDILFLSLPVRLFVGLSMIGLTVRVGAGVFDLMRERILWIVERLLTA